MELQTGNRSYNEKRLVETVANGNGSVIDSQSELDYPESNSEGYPAYTPTQRSLIVPDGAAARQVWLDELEDEIAVDRDINLERLYGLVGDQASDRYAP